MPIKVFLCYAREDAVLLEQLKTHLKPLEREQLIAIWYDRDINAGKEWGKEIDFHLNSSQIILLFVSPDFLASDYCYGVEMKRALERHEQGEAWVIPFIARPVNWENEPFRKLQMLPRDGQALTTWTDRDEVFVDSVKKIRETVKEINGASQHEILQVQSPKTAAPPFFKNADTIRQASESQILGPSLLLFLGSTAALSAVEVMYHMLTLKQGDRRHVALVYVDTDSPSPSLSAFRHQHKGIFQEYPLRIAVPFGVSNVKPIPQGLNNEDQTEGIFMEQHTFIQNKQPQYFANGAGGIRNNGHVAACFSYHSIYSTLEVALSQITRLRADRDEAGIREVQVNIVAFLGGGTGSGILSDVAAMARYLLNGQQYRSRINLFCILPEPMPGASLNDLNWQKSNATACLLELIAYSNAAAGDESGRYAKYTRNHIHHLAKRALADEVYLVGHTSMESVADIARIVGLDLFQRITDASGVGLLEHSKWAERRALGQEDSRGMPAMFGTSCPITVRFPTEETAHAFAQVSASYILPLLASYQPTTYRANEGDLREWEREWDKVARFDTKVGDPQAVHINKFRRADFEDASQSLLNVLWTRLERFERTVDQQISEISEAKRREELNKIKAMPRQGGGRSLIEQRIHYLQHLLQEYATISEHLKGLNLADVPSRPRDLEDKLVRQQRLPGRLGRLNRDFAVSVCEAYNEHMLLHARATRVQCLEKVLKELRYQVQDVLDQSLAWLRGLNVEERSQNLRGQGTGSMAWQGRLDHPHPYQRHLFDLKTLHTIDGRNVAAEQLYIWATGGDKTLEEILQLDYTAFVDDCMAYLAQYATSSNKEAGALSIEDHITGQLAEHIVSFFKEYYLHKFQNMNLFELLDKTIPANQKEHLRAKQISDYLLDHLQYMWSLISNSFSFDIDLSREELPTLETSLYFSMHWRDGHQLGILDRTLKILEPLTSRDQMPMTEPAIDPHRLQLMYGQHAISLRTIRDFSLNQNSAMEAYLTHQQKWMSSTAPSNLMPLHSSEETQRLVWDKNALGYGTPLPERIIR